MALLRIGFYMEWMANRRVLSFSPSFSLGEVSQRAARKFANP